MIPHTLILCLLVIGLSFLVAWFILFTVTREGRHRDRPTH